MDRTTKEIKEEILADEQAYMKIKRVFGNNIKPLKDYGTRILITEPKRKLVEAISKGYIDNYIQSTWWEILEKREADIEIIVNGKSRRIEKSQILPVNKMGIRETYRSGPIKLPKYNKLKIKNISLCYLGNKDIPEFYKGIAIQRGGMVIQRYQTKKILDEEFSEKIFGSVEMEPELESEMHQHEGPEHCDFRWVENPPALVLRVIKQEVKKFARKFKLIESENVHVGKKQREAELNELKELNNLADKLGLKGLGWKVKTRKGTTRDKDKPLRLSFSFKLPRNIPRVDIGEAIKEVYVQPVNEAKKDIHVNVKIFISNESERQLSLQEKSFQLSSGTVSEKIGWEEIKIDKVYKPGKYTIRAVLRSLEEINIANKSYEKGGEIYRVSRTFYVGVNPKSEGLFEDIKRQKNLSKNKYIWVEESDSGTGYVLYYNFLHPIVKRAYDKYKDSNFVKELHITREGLIYLLQIAFSKDRNLIRSGHKPTYFKESELKGAKLNSIINILLKYRSILLWDEKE